MGSIKWEVLKSAPTTEVQERFSQKPKQENIDRFGLTEDQANKLAEEVEKWNATKQQALFGGFTKPTDEDDEEKTENNEIKEEPGVQEDPIIQTDITPAKIEPGDDKTLFRSRFHGG